MSHDGKWVVRLDQRQNEADTHPDLQLIDQFWQRSIAERSQSLGDAAAASPSIRQLPTARFVLLINPAGEPVGMTGVILPHPTVRAMYWPRMAACRYRWLCLPDLPTPGCKPSNVVTYLIS